MRGLVVVAKRDQPVGENATAGKPESFSGGGFKHAILKSETHHLNDPRKRWYVASAPDWEVLANDDLQFLGKAKGWSKDETFDDRTKILKDVEAFWVGLPWLSQIYRYEFTWNEMDVDKNGKPCVNTRKEWTRYWYAMDFPYALVFDDAKTSEGLPVKLELLVTVRITNPQKALFETDDWLRQITAIVERIAKDYSAGHTYAELRGEAAHDSVQTGSDSLSKPIIKLTDQLPEEDAPVAFSSGTKGRYGITINGVDLKAVVLTGKAADEHEETSILEYNADRKAAARKVEAEGEAAALRTVGTAKADVIELTGKAEAGAAKAKLAAYADHPEIAATMMQADAMAKPGDGKTIFVAPDLNTLVKTFAETIAGAKP